MSEERVEVRLKRLADKVLSTNGNATYRLGYGEKLARLVLETLDGTGGRSPNHEVSEPEITQETETQPAPTGPGTPDPFDSPDDAADAAVAEQVDAGTVEE